MRVIDYFDRGALLDPGQIALISSGERFTYRELQGISHRIAAAMARRGIGGVPHAAILSRNDPLAVQALLGVFQIGRASCRERVYVLV